MKSAVRMSCEVGVVQSSLDVCQLRWFEEVRFSILYFVYQTVVYQLRKLNLFEIFPRCKLVSSVRFKLISFCFVN